MSYYELLAFGRLLKLNYEHAITETLLPILILHWYLITKLVL